MYEAFSSFVLDLTKRYYISQEKLLENLSATLSMNLMALPDLLYLVVEFYAYYLNSDEDNHNYTVDEAGKATGRLLKEVLINDKRTFETEDGYTRIYRWTGEENLS